MPEEKKKQKCKRGSEILAEETGKPESEFEYDGEVPDAEDQEWEPIDEDE